MMVSSSLTRAVSADDRTWSANPGAASRAASLERWCDSTRRGQRSIHRRPCVPGAGPSAKRDLGGNRAGATSARRDGSAERRRAACGDGGAGRGGLVPPGSTSARIRPRHHAGRDGPPRGDEVSAPALNPEFVVAREIEGVAAQQGEQLPPLVRRKRLDREQHCADPASRRKPDPTRTRGCVVAPGPSSPGQPRATIRV